MRPFSQVYKAVHDALPDDEKPQFRQYFDRLVNDALYVAPEAQGRLFDRLADGLYRLYGDPDTEWKQAISRIMRGEG